MMTQTSIKPNEVEIGLVQRHLFCEPVNIFGEGDGFASKSSVLMAEVQVVPLHAYGADSLQVHFSVNISLECPDNPMPPVSFFDHLGITQLRRDNELEHTRSSSLSRSRVRLKAGIPLLKGLPIGVKTITHPDRPAIFFKLPFYCPDKRTGQRSLGSSYPEGEHHPAFLGKGNPDPDFTFKRFALRRSSFFLTKLQRASNSI